MLGSVQISGEDIGGIETRDICDSLCGNSIRLLSLRGCKFEDSNFKKLTDSLKETKSLTHLNLNLGVVNSMERAKWLADGLEVNESLATLLLHGNPLGDEGIGILGSALEKHPKLKILDFGDCQLGDDAMVTVSSMLKHKTNKEDILELTLTGNRNISQTGWSQLSMALAHGTHLKSLYLDYNLIGDFGAGMISVALATMKNLEKLDLEGTGISDIGAELLCDVLESYNDKLEYLNLAENGISEDVLNEIKECLQENKSAKSFHR